MRLPMDHFLQALIDASHKQIPGFFPECLPTLLKDACPGQLRELRNALE